MKTEVKDMPVPADTIVKGTFDFQAQMGDGKALVIRGYIFDGEASSKQLDEVHDMIDRQRARTEIPKLQTEVDTLFMRLRQHKEHLESLISQRETIKSKEKLTSMDRKHLEVGSPLDTQITNIRTSLGQIQEEIDKGLSAIEVAEKKAI